MGKDPVSVFRRFDVLKDLPETALLDLARQCSWISAPHGKNIILANESTTEVYFITVGEVQVSLYSAAKGRQVLFASVGAYEIFGEVSALDSKPRSATVEAQGECELAVLKQEKFLKLLRDHPDFARAVLVRLATTVRRLSDRVYEFGTLYVESRVHAELLRCAQPDPTKKNQALVSPAPRAEFAARIATNRESVSRVISSMEETGLIKREGQDIRILDLERLRELIFKVRGG